MEETRSLKFLEFDGDEHLFYARISDDGKFVVGVWPVIFGFRVRAGYASQIEYGYELDYCCGDKVADVEMIFSAVLTALANEKSFDNFPRQKVKPMHNDPDCWAGLLKLVGDNDVIAVRTPDIHRMKEKYLARTWNQ